MTFDVNKAVRAAINGKDNTELERIQEENRAKFEPLSPLGQKILYGQRAVAMSQRALMHDLSAEQKQFEIRRMAEGFAYQGLLEQAIELDPKHEYVAKLEAIIIDGWCGCGIDRFLKEVFVYKGRSYNLYACPKCGFLNAE